MTPYKSKRSGKKQKYMPMRDLPGYQQPRKRDGPIPKTKRYGGVEVVYIMIFINLIDFLFSLLILINMSLRQMYTSIPEIQLKSQKTKELVTSCHLLTMLQRKIT